MMYSDRFIQILEELQVTPYALEHKFGIKGAGQAISNYKRKNNNAGKVSLNIVFAFLEKFESVNANYIIRGVGERFNEELNNSSKESLVAVIERLINEIDLKDSKIKDLESELSKRAL